MAMDTKQFVDAMLTLIENASHRKLRFTGSVIRGCDLTSIEDYLCELIDGRFKSDPRVVELVEAAREMLTLEADSSDAGRLLNALKPFVEAK